MGVRGAVRGNVRQDGVEGSYTARIVAAIHLQVGVLWRPPDIRVTLEARVTDVVDQVVVEERIERRIFRVGRWQVLPN